MIQIKDLTITHRKDLRTLVSDFQLVLQDGDKAVIIGEEGNGKSTLLQWIYDPARIDGYADARGIRILGDEKLAFLSQELEPEKKEKTVYEFFSEEDAFFQQSPGELGRMAKNFGVANDFYYREQRMGSLSGGEKIKAQLMRVLMGNPDVLLLDEPSNDVDVDTLLLLEKLICGWKKIVLFVSHKRFSSQLRSSYYILPVKKTSRIRQTAAGCRLSQGVLDAGDTLHHGESEGRAHAQPRRDVQPPHQVRCLR